MFSCADLRSKKVLALLLVLILIFSFGCAQKTQEEAAPKEKFIVLATTTSTYDSGLLDYLNPIFTAKTGIEVRIVSQGTGAALETGRRGDADVLLVHDRTSELKLVDEGKFVDRFDVMYNDFVLVGPEAEPAGAKNAAGIYESLKNIATAGAPFVSRGDDSGTHRVELRLWTAGEIDPAEEEWYFSIGQGMGDTLNMANEKLGYALTDRGTFVAMKSNLEIGIVFEGDAVLFNQYGVMAVNPAEHEQVKYELAKQYIDFLMSEEGQELISAYQVNEETLFFPGYGLE